MTDTPELTMVLTNWARWPQLSQVIDSLRQQSIPCRVFLWNNNPQMHIEDERVDWIVNSTVNVHAIPAIMMWQMTDTSFVARMDDDLTFRDERVLEDLIEVLKGVNRDQIVGAEAVRVRSSGMYSDAQIIKTQVGHGQLDEDDKPLPKPKNLPVDILRGRIMLLHREAVMPLSCSISHPHLDIHLSAMFAGRRRWHHVAAGCLWDRENEEPRLVDFEPDGKGYCDQKGHLDARDRLTKAWFDQCVWDHKGRRIPNT